MTGLAPYAPVVLVAAPLLVAIMWAARDEERRAVWAWAQPTEPGAELAPVAALAEFALRHATLAPRAVTRVVRSYCVEARQVLTQRRLRARLATALGQPSVGLPQSARAAAIDAWLRLLLLEVAGLVALRRWAWLTCLACQLRRGHAQVIATLPAHRGR
jgi:hypothetical protein